MRYVVDFKDGENIIGHYLCKSKQSNKSKSGKNYLSLKLLDKTGIVDAKVWELSNNIQSFEEGDFVKIDADVGLYQNEPQLRVSKLRRSAEGEYDPKDYIPCAEKDIGTMYESLTAYIKTVSNSYLRRLLENIIISDDEIKNRLISHSAAKNMHHSYMGGLVEHTLSVTKICDFLSAQYTYVNRDLLITAAMLHDIGKIYELSPFPDNDYTDAGQLIGHIVICAEMITEYSGKIPGFPPELAMLLKHCILSHHGEYEYGSPKLPQLIEAVLLHSADNLDAKTKAFEEAISGDTTAGNWLKFNRVFQRNIRKSDYLQ